jgi:hypothetical protein
LKFENQTDQTLQITYQVLERGEDRPSAQNSYLVRSGGSVDIQDDESLTGDNGGVLFARTTS